MDRIEELLQAPYWIIDILPMQVPKDSPGQYFAVEDYFLKEQLAEIKRKHINVILKLNATWIFPLKRKAILHLKRSLRS